MSFLLNPPFRGNFKTPRQSNLKSALQSPLGFGQINAWATGGNGTNNGPQQPGYDQNVSTGSLTGGLNHVGIYAALAAASAAITSYKATLTDTSGTFFDLVDLATGLDPLALPDGILSAVPVTNGIVPSGVFGGEDNILFYTGACAFNGWRIIFDSAVILGSDDSFTPSMNLVHAQLGTQYLAQAILQSQWSYLATNPRLAQTAAGGPIKWYYDAGQPAVTSWQVWGSGPPAIVVDTLPASTFTANPGPGLFWIVGIDALGNPVTPPSNGISSL